VGAAGDRFDTWLRDEEETRRSGAGARFDRWQTRQNLGRKTSSIAGAMLSPLGRVIDVVNRGLYAQTAVESEFMPEIKQYVDEPDWPKPLKALSVLPQMQVPAVAAGMMKEGKTKEGLQRAAKAFGRGLAGKDKKFTSEIWEERWGLPETRRGRVGRGIAGFLMDVLRDPATYVSVGAATKAGRGAKVLGERAPTLAKQAGAGQRALLQFAGQPLIYGEKALQPVSKAAAAIRPTKVGQAAMRGFQRGSTHPMLQRLLQTGGTEKMHRVGEADVFGWQTQKTAREIAERTGRDIGETSRGLLRTVEELGQGKITRDSLEGALEREFGEAAGQAGEFVGTWQKRMSTELSDMLKAGMTLDDWGEGYVSHFFTDEWHKRMGNLEKTPWYQQFIDRVGSQEPRRLTKDFTIDQFNEVLSTRGMKGIIPSLPDQLNFTVKKALHDDAAYIAERYLRGTAKARSGHELVEGIKKVGDLVSPDDISARAATGALEQHRILSGVKGLEGWAAPKELADELERLAPVVFGTEKIGLAENFVKGFFDPAQNWWKAWTLAPFPAYHTRNVVGNMWNCFLAGVRDPTVFHDAARIEMALWEPSTAFGRKFRDGARAALSIGDGRPKQLRALGMEDMARPGGAQVPVQLPGRVPDLPLGDPKKITPEDIRQLHAKTFGKDAKLPPRKLTSEDINKLHAKTFGPDARVHKPRHFTREEVLGPQADLSKIVAPGDVPVGNPLDRIAAKYGFRNFDHLASEMHKRGVMGRGWMAAEVPGLEPTAVTRLGRVLGQESTMVRGGRSVGRIMEDNARVGLFLDQVRKNVDLVGRDHWTQALDSAALTVKKYLFDYSSEGVTAFERRFLKRVMPFYTWTRNNVPLQLKELLKQPGKFGAIEKARRAHQQVLGPEPEEKYMSDWLRAMFPWRVRTGDGTKPEYMGLAGYLPAADLTKITRPLDIFMDLLSPALKLPMELAPGKGYSFFKERPLYKYPWEREELLGMQMWPKAAHALRTLRPVSEADWARKYFTGEATGPATLTRLLTGKIYPYDIERERRWRQSDARKELQALEREIAQESDPGRRQALIEYGQQLIQTVQ